MSRSSFRTSMGSDSETLPDAGAFELLRRVGCPSSQPGTQRKAVTAVMTGLELEGANRGALEDHAADSGRNAAGWAMQSIVERTDPVKLRELREDWSEVVEVPSPLSGEWADGLLLADLWSIADLDRPAWTTDASHAMEQWLADIYEAAFTDAFVAEVERILDAHTTD